MSLVLIGRAAHISLHHGLDCHEVFIRDKSFMSVLNLYPFCFVLTLYHTDFIVRSAALALSKNTDVNLIDEDALDCFVSPFCGIAGFEDGIELHTC